MSVKEFEIKLVVSMQEGIESKILQELEDVVLTMLKKHEATLDLMEWKFLYRRIHD